MSYILISISNLSKPRVPMQGLMTNFQGYGLCQDIIITMQYSDEASVEPKKKKKLLNRDE